MKKILLCTAIALATARFASAGTGDYSADHNALLSQLQAMGHGSFPESAWQDIFKKVQDISDRAEKAGDLDEVIEVNLVKAMVYSDMRKDYSAALAVLDNLKTRYASSHVAAMKKVYVKEADVYGQMGDEAGVRRVIDEFKASAFYDAEHYPFSGGQGLEVPLALVRPSATAGDSLSVTAMEVARTQSHFAPGNYFPDFNVVDQSGTVRQLADYRGKVLLVDFWVRAWTPWKRDLRNLAATYDRYRASGFEVLGICLEPSPSDLSAFLSKNGMTWPQVLEDKGLSGKLGIFGEATNFVIDRNGAIVGRDLHGADLVEAVKAALGSQ